MSPSLVTDVFTEDDEMEESNAKMGRFQKSNKRPKGQENEEDNRNPNGFITGCGSNISSVSSQCGGGSGSLVDESAGHQSGPNLCLPPICRQFWKAGNYELDKRQCLKAARLDETNHLRVHPMFLHSNATSHKWVFGAIAELVDNAYDEIPYGATFVDINKISSPLDGSPVLIIQDDGGGMDPEALRCCMSFGFSKKTKHAIGRYGNGFKASTMRLGADVIVFSRHMKGTKLTQSVGLLSYTFLRRMNHDRIIVPMVNYEYNTSTMAFEPILPHGKEHFFSKLAMLIQWSPYLTEEELLKQFDDIGHHGTKIIIYNLWLNDDGDTELDFDSDAEDIHISGDPKLSQAGHLTKSIFNLHLANIYQHSLRVYLSILYLRLPLCFNVKLRGQVVEQHNIANDLKFPEFILYKPHIGGNDENAVITTIGFLKEAPDVNVHGFNIYHRNRLILPFLRVLKHTTNSYGRGVVGILEANYIEPSHSKQDFEKTSLFQKLEDRLKQMTIEYWRLHCDLIGYQPDTCPPTMLPSQALVPSSTHNSSDQLMSSNHSSSASQSSEAACAVRKATKRRHGSAQICQRGLSVKCKGHNPSGDIESGQVYAADTWHNVEKQPYIWTVNQVLDQDATAVIQENKKLRLQLSELEKKVENFNLKVQLLQSELNKVQYNYKELLVEVQCNC